MRKMNTLDQLSCWTFYIFYFFESSQYPIGDWYLLYYFIGGGDHRRDKLNDLSAILQL